jgi:hypothetical protein
MDYPKFKRRKHISSNSKNKCITASSFNSTNHEIHFNDSLENRNNPHTAKISNIFGTKLNREDFSTNTAVHKNKIQEIDILISKEKDCARNLKSEDNKDWHCKLKYHKLKATSSNNNKKSSSQALIKKPLFYVCYYEYNCNLENEKFFFSFDYLIKLSCKTNYFAQ